MINIIDCGSGNIFSICQALTMLKLPYQMISEARAFDPKQTVLLPGVGAFADAMQIMADSGLDSAIRDFAAAGGRIIGICLGMQLLLDKSDEFGAYAGLGLIPGKVHLLPIATSAEKIRIPNTGWRQLQAAKGEFSKLLRDQYFYFSHSYVCHLENSEHQRASITINDNEVPAVIQSGNTVGIQFHPEKSGEQGLLLMQKVFSC